MADHGYFEFLSTLAGSDLLTGPEEDELHRHSLQCIACRNRIREMTRLDVGLHLGHALTHPCRRLPEGMRERFVARATGEGIPLNQAAPTAGSGSGAVGLAAALFFVLLVTAATLKGGYSPKAVVNIDRSSAVQVTQFPAATETSQAMIVSSSRIRRPVRHAVRESSGRGAKAALPACSDVLNGPQLFAGTSPRHFALATPPLDLNRFEYSISTPSRPRFEVSPVLIGKSALYVLADSRPFALAFVSFQPKFAFAAPNVLRFPPTLDPPKMPLKFERSPAQLFEHETQ